MYLFLIVIFIVKILDRLPKNKIESKEIVIEDNVLIAKSNYFKRDNYWKNSIIGAG